MPTLKPGRPTASARDPVAVPRSPTRIAAATRGRPTPSGSGGRSASTWAARSTRLAHDRRPTTHQAGRTGNELSALIPVPPVLTATNRALESPESSRQIRSRYVRLDRVVGRRLWASAVDRGTGGRRPASTVEGVGRPRVAAAIRVGLHGTATDPHRAGRGPTGLSVGVDDPRHPGEHGVGRLGGFVKDESQHVAACDR